MISPIRPPDQPGHYSYQSRTGFAMMALGALGILFRDLIGEDSKTAVLIGCTAFVLIGTGLVIRLGVRADAEDLDKLR